MPINESVTMDDDLTSLEPVGLICAIQGLLLRYASDEVRDTLTSQDLNIAYDAPIPRKNESFSAADLLESPFFIIKNLTELPDVQTNARNRRLSGNVSTTARAVLENFYSFNVTFGEWDDFQDSIGTEEDITSLGKLPKGFSNWGRMISNLLSNTFQSDMRGQPGETQELTVMYQDLSIPFAAFGFNTLVNNHSGDDVTFETLTGEQFMYTEGKESACLPRRLCNGGHHLCSFGFATKLARTPHTEAEYNDNRVILQGFLNVDGREPSENTVTSKEPSNRTIAILRQYETVLAGDKAFVHENFTKGLIDPRDPVNLWAATMQACIYSIINRRAMTIVQSARMWWFIKLDIVEEECVVKISKASKVGSKNFLLTVIKFLRRAYQTDLMSKVAQEKWEHAIVRPNRPNRKSQRQANRKRPGPTAGEETNENAGQRASKRSRGYSTRKKTSCSYTESCSDPIMVVSSESFEDDEDEEIDGCFGYDEFGMTIPYFNQIGETLEVLGRGRSGDVTKVVWNEQHVALKKFTLQFDDNRTLESVYEHELEVLRGLRKLWGEHVPELLFHKPWPTSPMIGLELGEPLPDDMSEWSRSDLQKANESVEKIRKLGWRQTDFRGANFVRLKGNKIAMIDFESMEKVPPADQA